MPGSTIPGEHVPRPLLGILGDLVDLPPGGVALVHGPRGVGKTSLLLQSLENPWVVTCEMVPELVQRYAARMGVRLAGISVPEWQEDPPELFLNVPRAAEPPDLLVDSLTATGRPVEALAAVQVYCRHQAARALVIAQQTKEGEVRGSATLGFDVDVEIRLDYDGKNRRIIVEKNRFGALGSTTFCMKDGVPALPDFDRYYSVEGEAGRYRLEPYPNPKARYADYLKKAEQSRQQGDEILRLPDPPLAVSALHCDLYKNGWVEPADFADRRAFAKRYGVPYYSPCEKS